MTDKTFPEDPRTGRPALRMCVYIPEGPDAANIIGEIALRICELEAEHGIPGRPITYTLAEAGHETEE